MAKISFTLTSVPVGKEGVLKPDSQGYYEQIIGGLNTFNSAGMYYTAKDEVLKLFRDSSSIFRRRIEKGALRGEVGHPRKLPGMSMSDFINRVYDIQESNTCVQFREVWVDDTLHKNPDGTPIWTIVARFIPSGPHGHMLEKQLQNSGENVCFSIRAITNDYYKDSVLLRDLLEIITFDYVNEPGIKNANKYSSPALENEWLVSKKDYERAIQFARNSHAAFESITLTEESMNRVFKKSGFRQTKEIIIPHYLR